MTDDSRCRDQAIVDETLTAPLFALLTDSEQAVRVAALRVLVRLDLPKRLWGRLAALVDEQFDESKLPETPSRFPLPELVNAAIRIPMFGLRRRLYDLLQEYHTDVPHRQLLALLVAARDENALDFIWPVVQGPDRAQAQEAAYWVAHYDYFYASDPYRELAFKAHDPVVRFWLCIALLHQGDVEPFTTFIIQYLDGRFDLPLLYGSPGQLARTVVKCGSYPESFLALLRYLTQPGENNQPDGISLAQLEVLNELLSSSPQRDALLALVDELIKRLEPASSAAAPSPDKPSSTPTPWRDDPKNLIPVLFQSGWPDPTPLLAILPAFTAAQKTSFITAWFMELAKLVAPTPDGAGVGGTIGTGNTLIQLPGWFWQGFEPDLEGLFNAFLLIYPYSADLSQQLAWVTSRAGVVRLLEVYLPALPLLNLDQRIALLTVLEWSVRWSSQEFGPLYGEGSSASEPLPVYHHFIDELSASAGDMPDHPSIEPPPSTGLRDEGSGEDQAPSAGDEVPLPSPPPIYGGHEPLPPPSTSSPGEDQPPQAAVTPRFVQGEVYDYSHPDDPRKLERAFIAGREHLLRVWIGERVAGAITAPRAINIDALPDLPSWDLQVYFWEPNHAPAVQLGKLTIYQKQLPDQPINTCTFTFTPRPDLPTFQGRLAVVYQGNVLQMLFLEGRVVADPASNVDDDQISFQWAEVKGLGNPSQLQKFDLVFYNESDAVQGAGLTFFGGRAGLKHISKLDDGIKGLIATLSEAAIPGELSLEANKDTLLILASHGSMLYTTILEQIGSDSEALLHLRQVKRLQLISAVRDVFPLELVYVYPAPQPGAELCPNAQQAILTGACHDCDGIDEERAARTICPMGFLGLRCTIERHAIQPLQKTDAMLDGKDFQLWVGLTAGSKTINPLKSSLCAASAKVTDKVRKKFTTSMQALFPDHFEFAQNWNEWKRKIEDGAPTLLVLFPHTEKSSGIPSLEIGGATLWKTAIKEALVRKSKDTAPIVLLIGCTTALPETPYQGFAADFSRAGAVITLTTMSLVHESRAVPITEILIKQFQLAVQTRQTFSEALLQARRTAMAAGYAEVLTLVADGDADWVLSKEA